MDQTTPFADEPSPSRSKRHLRHLLQLPRRTHQRLSSIHARIPYLRKLPLSAILVIALLIIINLVVWAICGLILASHTHLLSTAALAYTLGLRHALDADHISAIDLMTRRLIATGQRPVTVGTFFSLGHSTIVIVTSIVVAATAAGVSSRFDSFGNVGGIIGTSVSAAFLILLGIMNAYILYKLVVQIRKIIRLQPGREEAAEAWKIEGGGCLFRALKKMFRLIDRPWKMYPLGVLFGLGFDTSSEIALLGISSIQGASGTSMWLILVFPVLFTAGMCLVDTTDGALMMSLYVAPMGMGMGVGPEDGDGDGDKKQDRLQDDAEMGDGDGLREAHVQVNDRYQIQHEGDEVHDRYQIQHDSLGVNECQQVFTNPPPPTNTTTKTPTKTTDPLDLGDLESQTLPQPQSQPYRTKTTTTQPQLNSPPIKDPLTFLYYSIVLTTLTVICAIIIGVIQLLSLILNVASPKGRFWTGVQTAGDYYEVIGGSICASFLVFGGLSVLCYKPWRRWVDKQRQERRERRERGREVDDDNLDGDGDGDDLFGLRRDGDDLFVSRPNGGGGGHASRVVCREDGFEIDDDDDDDDDAQNEDEDEEDNGTRRRRHGEAELVHGEGEGKSTASTCTVRTVGVKVQAYDLHGTEGGSGSGSGIGSGVRDATGIRSGGTA